MGFSLMFLSLTGKREYWKHPLQNTSVEGLSLLRANIGLWDKMEATETCLSAIKD